MKIPEALDHNGHYTRMELFGLLIVSPLWGNLSPRLFLRSWLSFLGILATFVCLMRTRTHFKAFFLLFCTHFTEMFFTFTLLMAGFYILYFHLPFGRNNAEVLVYWICSTVQLGIILPSVSGRIDQMLEQAQGISPADNEP